MNKKYFGTDGIRGKVGNDRINPQFFLKLGWAIGRVFKKEDRHARVVIGKDTRISGYMFESVLQAGLAAAGTDIILLGPMPTPAIAYLTRTFNADVGVVISASHNSYLDNGIKFFSEAGTKLDDELEVRIEEQLDQEMDLVEASDLGKAARVMDVRGRYIEFCKSTVARDTDISDFNLVLDCANGATYSIAPKVFSELGTKIKVINATPDGININYRGGSTDPAILCEETVKQKADMGIAFDGDGDRVILCDRHGKIVDGDVILYILAKYMKARGLLRGDVVGTVMSNSGMERSLQKLGVKLRRVAVGDRHIIAELLEKNAGNLGGESSGHIVFTGYTTTGDGIIAALQVLAALKYCKVSLSAMIAEANLIPAVHANIRVKNPHLVAESAGIKKVRTEMESRMNGECRIIVRASGTEPLLRMTVETEDATLRRDAMAALKAAAERANG